jgi:hypothetical protein
MDVRPRRISKTERAMLQLAAEQVMREIEGRVARAAGADLKGAAPAVA